MFKQMQDPSVYHSQWMVSSIYTWPGCMGMIQGGLHVQTSDSVKHPVALQSTLP